MTAKAVQWEHSSSGGFNDDLYAFFYAAYASYTRGYTESSDILARTMNRLSIDGIHSKKILDLGCGIGITAERISQFSPSSILSVEQSAPMANLMHTVLCRDDNELSRQLTSDQVMGIGRHYDACLRFLSKLRKSYRDTNFYRKSAKDGKNTRPLRIQNNTADACIDYCNNVSKDKFDGIAGNHFIHWWIAEVRNALEANIPGVDRRLDAVTFVLRKLQSVLHPNGVMVFSTMESSFEDEDPAKEAYNCKYGVRSHPVLQGFENTVLDIVQKRYSISKKQNTNKKKHMSKQILVEACNRIGLKLLLVERKEILIRNNPFHIAVTGTPMLLGTYPLMWDQKIAILHSAIEKVRGSFTDAEMHAPIRLQNYTFAIGWDQDRI